MPPERSGGLRRGQRIRFQSTRALPDATIPPRTRRNRQIRPLRCDSPRPDPPRPDPPRRDPPRRDPPRVDTPPIDPPSLSLPQTYLFSIQVFVDGELLYDDGDTLELAQFNYTLQEEKLAQKLANWRGERGGELIKTRSSCCLSSNKKNGNMTIEVFSRDDWAKIERCLTTFFSDRTRKNIAVKWLIQWAFQHEENLAPSIVAEGEPITTRGTEIQANAESEEGVARPRVS
jgi:hypothetical protein